MTLHLVRNAKAEKAARWDGPEPLRPLAPLGLRQARAVAERLAGVGLARILSSPHLRCRQTVEPLAAHTGLPVEVHACLAKGEPPGKALDLLRGLGDPPVACCTHAGLIAELAGELEEARLALHEPRRARVAGGNAPETRRLAVLDLGSTSFRLLVADVTLAGWLRPVGGERRMLRLGAALAAGAGFPEEVCDRALRSAALLRRRAARLGAERLIAVGTAALRDAANGATLVERLTAALGTPVRLLSGAEEAHLIFAALRRRVLLPEGATLGLDLGGGSLELAVGDAETVRWETTLPLGVARLHRALVRDDPMGARDVRAIRHRVRTAVEPARSAIARYAPRLAVASGGTVRALGQLALAARGLGPVRSVNGLVLPAEELRRLAQRLLAASHRERLRMPGMRRRRADLLPAGAAVLAALARPLGLQRLTLSDWGLREGILLDAARQDLAPR